ncbi:MAG: type III pantothenate kinase [Bacteroidales bacterium]|nr:type III pantothenate kinase [Bacteroidales bacterium]
MNLVIDFGNSLLKLALFRHDQILDHRVLTGLDADRLRWLLDEFRKRESKDERIEATILSSVIPVPGDIRELLMERFRLIELGPETLLPFTNAYITPGTLGKDRIALAAGAVRLFPGKDVLVIDAGTCITFDFISHDGTYHGGSISPGLHMRFRALNAFTAALPSLQPGHHPVELIGRSTVDSIRSGVVNGAVVELEGIAALYRKRYPRIIVAITGGDADFFAEKLKSDIFATPNLLMAGLNHILNFNG